MDDLAGILSRKKVKEGETWLCYRKFWKALLENQEFIRHPRVGDGLQDYFLEKLLDDPNVFHQKAEKTSLKHITPALVRDYGMELADFKKFVLGVDWKHHFSSLLKRQGFPNMTFEEMR